MNMRLWQFGVPTLVCAQLGTAALFDGWHAVVLALVMLSAIAALLLVLMLVISMQHRHREQGEPLGEKAGKHLRKTFDGLGMFPEIKTKWLRKLCEYMGFPLGKPSRKADQDR